MPTLAPSSRRTPATSKCSAMARRTRGGDRHAGGRRLDRAQEDRELVAAQARDGVVLAEQAREALAHLAQHLVAVVVAEGVVDLLEAVEVEQHDRDAGLGAARRRAIACWVRVRKRTRLGRPVSASCRARRSAMSAWRPARWTAIMGRASSGSSTGAESSASTASGARPSRMPSVADWRMSSEEIWSRRRVPDVTAMAPATRPVLTTKKTSAAARMAGTSAALKCWWWGRTPAATRTPPAAAMARHVLRDVEGAARRALAIDDVAQRGGGGHRDGGRGQAGGEQQREGEGGRRSDLALPGAELDRDELADDDGAEQDPHAHRAVVDERRSVEGGDVDEQPEPRRDDGGDVEAGAHVQRATGGGTGGRSRGRPASGAPRCDRFSSTCARCGSCPRRALRCAAP